jgi:hypothetical protein
MAERRIAFLVGNMRHDEEPSLPPLRCPKNDVDDLEKVISYPTIGYLT